MLVWFRFKVLDLEQMLTTGGGWQDQVGGLYPGVKIGSSKNKLPLQVEAQPVKVPEGFIEKLERHLLVVFTGKTRLARNMLQVCTYWSHCVVSGSIVLEKRMKFKVAEYPHRVTWEVEIFETWVLRGANKYCRF